MARDPWSHLSARTPARIAIGRTGGSLPTSEVLAFALAHAKARDAVHAPFEPQRIVSGLTALGLTAIVVESLARDRAAYLRRPDWGRQLAAASGLALDAAAAAPADLALVIADGLSATAVEANALALVAALLPRLASAGISLAPAVVATGARVALGDVIAARFRAKAVLVLIGERPGLSAPDSLGAYLTFDAKAGRHDAERNCVSNIRAGGLPADNAAFKLTWLIAEALRRKLTGIRLKDESDLLLSPGGTPPALIG